MLQRNFQIGFLIVSILVAHPMMAQKWTKSFAKLDASYEKGEYATSKKGILKLEKKIRKKLGAKNTILASALVRKAKYNDGLGLLNEVEDVLMEAIKVSEEANAEKPEEHGYLLKEAVEVFIEYGNFRLAGDYLAQAREKLEASGKLIDALDAELDMLQVKVLAGKGFYQQAIELADSRVDFFQSEVAKAGKKDEKPRVVFGDLLITKANAFRKMGNYISSDSAFIYNDGWLKKNLDKTHRLYAKNHYFNTQLLEENGLEVSAQAKRYEDVYLLAIRKYSESEKTLITIQESLLKALYENKSKQKFKIVKTTFNKTLSRSFPKKSVHNLTDDLIKLNYKLIKENIKSLEDKVNILLTKKIIPENHAYRITLLEFANEIALLRGTHKNVESYQNAVLKIKEHLYGTDAPDYHLTKVRIANYLIDYSDRLEEADSIYEESFHQIVRPEITDGHVEYLEVLNHLASFYEENDEYDRSEEILEEALLTARKKYDNKDIAYGKELEKIADLQIQIGQYEKADENLEEAINIFNDIKTDESKTSKSLALITKARLLGIKGQYDEAEEAIFKSFKLSARGAISAETSFGFKDKLAGLYIKLGRLSDAEEILSGSVREKTNQFGPESRQLNELLTLQSELKLTQGDYTDAEKLARRANNLSTKVFGVESTKVVPSMIRLADVYSTIGDYDKAEVLLTNAITIQKLQFGSDHVDVAKSTSKLALVKFYKGNPLEEVQELFTKSERIIGKRLGGSNPTYAEILKNLAIVNIAAAKYNIAFGYLDDAGRIWNAKIGRRNNINAATINVLKGDIYYRQKRYNRAEGFYEEAKKQFENFFSDQHPEYVKVQSKLAKTYYMQRDWKKSQAQMEDVLSQYQQFIADYFPALSEREKTKFWNTIKTDYEFYNTLIISKNNNSKYLGNLFNNALLTKALLLNSSIKIRQRINNSADEELKVKYATWIEKKELLTAALSMSEQQLTENGINTSSLNNEVELLEKEISEKSALFGQSFENEPITWENVKSALKENEVAVEMVRFRVFDHMFQDSVVYAMLYISGEKKSTPQAVIFGNGSELESRYLKNYRNSIKFKLKDRYSYDYFWKPITEELGTVSTLYVSPDGVYNQINLEAIPTPDGRYVIDNSNIILLSNTKDLYESKRRSRSITEKQVAMLFGNPTFYIDTRPGRPKPESGLTRSDAAVITDLPGTKKEIAELKEYLGDRGWEIDEYTELNADEPSIKAVTNPRIFHVATHGFFQSEKRAVSSLDAELRANTAYENPLLKTGLLLAGAGDILNETRYNYNVNNGILTAYEAMNLNLDQTDLVVLSACETGLGEIEAGEGVYGLQRAFLVAGAKTIIMSLFKVSDEATQLLMVKFYRKWIESGDKRKAFLEAKKEIRNEFSDPLYWGPFLMIGLD